MHLLITDSGVGGLSVCAYAERYLRTSGVDESVKFTYVNASPENDFGYNSMGSRREKIDYFTRFLNIVTESFSPDAIFIACNTLSVLYPETDFSHRTKIHVRGIVETGVDMLMRKLRESPVSIVTIFGTPTTIEEQTFDRRLQENGIHEESIITQSCPSLADTISEDRQGSMAKKKIDEYVDASLKKTQAAGCEHLSYLACTHYGYRKDLFATAFEAKGFHTEVVDPNEIFAENICEYYRENINSIKNDHKIRMEVISRYRIPETTLDTIRCFLENISPMTVRAFGNYTHAPDLF